MRVDCYVLSPPPSRPIFVRGFFPGGGEINIEHKVCIMRSGISIKECNVTESKTYKKEEET